MKRKHILLKNEITMIQKVLRDLSYPTEEYCEHLANKLEELKREWYKVKIKQRIKEK